MYISIRKFSIKSGISPLTLSSYVRNGLLEAKKVRAGNSTRFLLKEDDISHARSIRDKRVLETRAKFAEFKKKQSKNGHTNSVPTSKEVLKWLYNLSGKEFRDFESKFSKLKSTREEIGI